MLKIGHRGASGTRPENSCAAFKEALRCKVDMIELDVRTTKDDKLVVFHDEDLKRVCGVNEKVAEITLKEFKKYDIGSFFSVEYSNERVMTLQEIINMIGVKTGINIEAKVCGDNREILAVKIANLIIGEGIEKKCVITSFDIKFIKIFKEMYPDIKAGVIFEEENEKWHEIIEECRADGVSINYKILEENYITECKKNGYFLYIWSINDSYEIKKYKKMKIDGIMSDFPSIL